MGCGAIGSGIARSTLRELKGLCRLSGFYDQDLAKAQHLQDFFPKRPLVKTSFSELLGSCDFLVEAITAPDTCRYIKKALSARKDVLVMSVGKMLKAQDLFSYATRRQCKLLIPSGAIAGIDAIKAASLGKIQHIILTTRKPTSGLKNNAYLTSRGIDVTKIKKETLLFEGDVDRAVKWFPYNINVAATLAIASQAKSKLVIRLITSPTFRTNSHEIELTGECGHILCRTENVISPENPKTSYLAVLSGIQTIKDYCTGIKIGT